MYSIDRTSPVPPPIDNHSVMSNETETEIESSTPELNLLLDKLTEILRFRSSCRRHFGQQQSQQSNSTTTTNLKRLQSGSIDPLHNIHNSDSSAAAAGAWKPSISNRSSHHHHHNPHVNHSINDKRRRLPSLLQRLIDEGNLIKEAVRRLKSQRFTHSFKQQTQMDNTPSTPITKSSSQTLPNVKLSSTSINIPQQLSDPPTQTTSSPNRGISWFLSSSVFGTTNHSSGSGSPLRNCCSSGAHDRTPMEVGIHDG
ncbi:unnamed protein product [Rotaria magnacalcarata]|uniref:Uncharacterized protein n=3 Tax=Rotaria magnacalcarata TaxID=392030 RepID=A0A816DKG3_9BILA|nr:unnamed protein product [Rotaria magnacalcarata]CAF1634149.1 unnamed protein product [Rotaria magnacalcarata]CAF4047374.1 unnamed protein product [Rotaria magnacalcarata]CAF4097711.1 unnamed protein product [Rotaria magnacalcarata]